MEHSAERVAMKVWDIGNSIDVVDRGNQSSIIVKLVEMELRDTEAASNAQTANASDGIDLVSK